jgi:TolB-like protein/Flp pilus assembly protein TadD
MSFFEELKRRKVIRVGIAYVIGAWLLLQLTEVLSELLDLPDAVGPVVVGLVALGFPVVVVLAWVFELTADGLKRDSEVAPGERTSGKFINAVVIVLLVTALGYFVWESRFREPASAPPSETATSVQTNAAGQAIETPRIGRSIAVLPFENFSGNPDDAYFADGLSDTLLHQLAQIEELKVIARNSSFQYKGTNRDVREIGTELGVETILEGSVQRAGERVRIIAQLVRSSDGAHVWSRTFDGTMDDIFALQDQVAADVVDAFQISLSAAEREQLMRDGTDDPVAYDLLIQALGVDSNLDEMVDLAPEDDLRIKLINEAIARDPDYALAWAHLARAWNVLAFATDSGADWTRFVAEAEAAAQKAVDLDPDLAAAHNALGWVAHRRGERLAAEQHFRKALELDPNELGAMSGLALQLWQDPEEALAIVERSLSIDPKSAMAHRQRHFFLFTLGRIDDASDALLMAIELEPDEGMYYNDLHDLYELQGRPDEGARMTSRLLRRSPNSFSGQLAMAEAWIAATDFERAGKWTEVLLRERPDSDAGRLLEAERLISANRHEETLALLFEIDDSRKVDWEIRAWTASSCLSLGRTECARREIARWRDLMAENALRGESYPESGAISGLFELLVREREGEAPPETADLERMLAVFEQSRWFRYGSYYVKAGLLARLGRDEEAFKRLEGAIEGPGGAVQNLDLFGATPEVSLLLDPLRSAPGFDDWLVRYAARRDAMRARMVELEARGEIIRPAAIERITGP